MSRSLPLKYLPFAWSGLIFIALVFIFLGATVRGDPRPLLKEWGVSVDVFAMTAHEIGLLFGVVITLRLLLKKGGRLSDLGVKSGFKAVWAVYAVAGFAVAILLYPVVPDTVLSLPQDRQSMPRCLNARP